MEFDHNKQIAEAAKQVLLPAGLKRIGKSRSYYDDNGWWCTLVEFQPSGFSKGSYLNVGVSWLLYEEDYWSVNVGSRQQGFSSAKNEGDFKEAVMEKALHAKQLVESNREKFSTISKAHAYYQSIKRSGWSYYYAAVIAAMDHDYVTAAENFNSLLSYPEETEWEKELNLRVRVLLKSLNHPKVFIEIVTGIVLRSRMLHRLESKEPALLGLSSVEDF
jgi:hypothetical protein